MNKNSFYNNGIIKGSLDFMVKASDCVDNFLHYEDDSDYYENN